MNWVERVLQIEAFVREDDQEGKAGTLDVMDSADVIWAAWSDDGFTPKIRVIRGRDLSGPDLRHGALAFKDEREALEFAEEHGDKIGLREDATTPDVPEPAVPAHLIDLLMDDPVLLYDGKEAEFV